MFKIIEIFHEKKANELFDLYSVSSAEINKEIKKKLAKFQSSHKFFEHYTNKNINQLLFSLSKFNSNLSELFYENQNISDTQIDKYLSNLSKIYLALNLIHKIHEILTNILELTKNCYSKLICENKYQVIHAKPINEYINELIDTYSNKNYILFTPKFSNSSSQINEKTLSFNNNFNEEDINFSNFFKIKNRSHSVFNNTNLINTGVENENEVKKIDDTLTNPEETEEVNFKYEGNFSHLTLKEMKFIIEEQNEIEEESDIRKVNSCLNTRIGFLPDKKPKKNQNKTTIENNPKKEMCIKLLEVIIKLYKNCIINSEEKLKLKQLVISKSKKIEQIYKDYFVFSKYDKNELIKELKKLYSNYIKPLNDVYFKLFRVLVNINNNFIC